MLCNTDTNTNIAGTHTLPNTNTGPYKSTCCLHYCCRAIALCTAGACLSPPGLPRQPDAEPWPLLDCLGALDNAPCTTICSTGYVPLDPAGGPTVRCSKGQWHSSIEPGTGCKAEGEAARLP